MKHLVFTIYDIKAKAYLQPFMSINLGVAIRSVTDCLTDKNHQFAKHPADYTLFHISDFDDNTAIYTPVPDAAPIKLIELMATVTPSKENNKLEKMTNDEVLENLKNSQYENRTVV